MFQDDEIELAGLNDSPGALPNPEGVRWKGENDSNAGKGGSRTALTRTKKVEGMSASPAGTAGFCDGWQPTRRRSIRQSGASPQIYLGVEKRWDGFQPRE
ncbi:MAG: hypothetical protein GX455_06915 [Phycisphaerae bacterium]|nr:hypothetical protein [Phycisphaerae bacterium]